MSCYRNMEPRKIQLGITIMEFSALTDGISIFLETSYILEGDSKRVLISYEVFNSTEHAIDKNYKWSSVNRVFDDTLGLICKRRDTFLYQKQMYSTKLEMAKQILLNPMNIGKD